MEPPDERRADDERLAQQQAKMRQILVAMKEERAQNETTINELQTELNEERERSEALEDKVVKLVEMVKTERKRAQEAEQQIGNEGESLAQQKLQDQEKRVKELEECLAQKQEEASRWEGLQEKEGESEKLLEKVSELQAKLELQQEQEEGVKNDLKKAQDELSKARLYSDQLSSELTRQIEDKREAQAKIDKLKDELASAKHENNANSNAALVVLQSENERLRKELTETTIKSDENQSLADEASQRADTFETKLATLITVLKDLKAERLNWTQREAELQAEIESFKRNTTDSNVTITQIESKVTPIGSSDSILEHPEFKAMQNKLQAMENEIAKHVSKVEELKREVVSVTNKLNLSETTCDKLRDEVEKLQNQAKAPQIVIPPPAPAPSGPPGLPPPPPPPPAFKKLSGKLEIKKSAKKPAETSGASAGDNLKVKLMEEITKGVTLRKVQPSAPKPAPPQDNESNSMFSLGAMASMLAKKRMARISMRIEADDPLKGSLDVLLAELNNK